jgi:hypothetical protein
MMGLSAPYDRPLILPFLHVLVGVPLCLLAPISPAAEESQARVVLSITILDATIGVCVFVHSPSCAVWTKSVIKGTKLVRLPSNDW